ncbi:MAG: NVEALA domain-containing protein [Bacteroidales bacterium]|nr:NVEALA domain-containing protein [Bacteroidales bacterium]
MKKIIISIVALVVAAVATVSMTSRGESDSIFVANVEALAEIEQPDVNDCIPDPNYDCEALHPTDPTKDKYREGARW